MVGDGTVGDGAGKHLRKYTMRLSEIQPIKHIKPLKPPQARIYKLKAGVEQSREALRAEKESQKRQREMDKRYKSQTHAASISKLR